jgi:integrase/recombinase XerD
MASHDTPRTHLKLLDTPPSYLSLKAFLLDRQAANLSPRTVDFYRQKLVPFLRFLEGQGVQDVDSLSTDHVRGFLVSLQSPERTPGGVHAYYRAVKAFLRWCYQEGLIDSDIMARVKAPKVPEKLLEPVSLETVRALLGVCDRKSELGARDYAVILCLLDNGLRASEFLALDVADLDLDTGRVLVRKTKGGRQRVCFLSAKSRMHVLKYLRLRQAKGHTHPALWVNRQGKRLGYTGLRDILRRRARDAGIPAPTLHGFRRAYALLSLRGGADIVSLSRLLGHSNLATVRRYLRQTEGDLREVHERTSPVGRL